MSDRKEVQGGQGEEDESICLLQDWLKVFEHANISLLTMTIPPDCSAVHILMMGAIPMVVPWK